MRSHRKPALCAALVVPLLVVCAQMGVASGAELKIFGSRVTKMIVEDIGPQFERATGHRLVVLERVTNPDNIGAVFRGAAALGMDAVLLSPTCADPLYRRSVRVSMGEVFAVPYAILDPWPDALEAVKRAGFTVLALTPSPGALPIQRLTDAQRAKPALILGAEGPGLTEAAIKASDQAVVIPMHAGVDSLNVAAAAAVAFWELCRNT